MSNQYDVAQTGQPSVSQPQGFPYFLADQTAAAQTYAGTTIGLKALKGIYDGTRNVNWTDANFIASNVLSGKTLFGLTGTANIKYATGAYAATNGYTSLTVSGLAFKPMFIMYSGNTMGMWIKDYVNTQNYSFVQSGSGFAYSVWLQTCTIASDGFSGTVYNSDNVSHSTTWYAWGTI